MPQDERDDGTIQGSGGGWALPPADDMEKVHPGTGTQSVALETPADGVERGLDAEAPERAEIDNTNEFFLGVHMGTMRPGHYPAIIFKQQAYRFAAWVLSMGEGLPDDPAQLGYTFEEYVHAVQNA